MLQQLINTALLGTDKLGFDEQKLPEAIRNLIQQLPQTDKEAYFLKTAALVHFYEMAGQQPQQFIGEFPQESTQNELPVASESYCKLLFSILELGMNVRSNLLEMWLDKLAEKQHVANYKATIALLNLAENISSKMQVKIQQVLSQRGLDLWVYKHNKPLERALDNAQIWTEGKATERRALFVRLREEHPQQAITFLASTWTQESLSDKIGFIEGIKATFQPEDIPFLEALLPEFSYLSKERKTQRLLREITTGLLLSEPTTTVYQQTTELLKGYITKEKSKGLLGWVGKEQPLFLLPETEDTFWNTATMLSTFGFETTPDTAIFVTNQHYWLACFLEYLPLGFWVNHWECSVEEVLHFFISEKYQVKLAGRNTAIFLAALIKNAVQHRNKDLTNALLKATNLQDQLPLLAVLSPAEREKYLIDTQQLTNFPALQACFNTWKGTWSAQFSTKLLSACYTAIVEGNTYLPDHFTVFMVSHLHPSANQFLQNAKIYPLSATPYYTHHWEKSFVNVLLKTLEIRQQITTLA